MAISLQHDLNVDGLVLFNRSTSRLDPEKMEVTPEFHVKHPFHINTRCTGSESFRKVPEQPRGYERYL